MPTLASLQKRIEEEEHRREEADAKLRKEIASTRESNSLQFKALEDRIAALESQPPPIEPPAPEPTPDPAWKTVFEDDFAHGLGGFAGIDPRTTDNDGTMSAAPDGTCSFFLAPGQGRTELSINNGTDAQKWTEGEQPRIGEKFWVPNGFPYGGPGNHCTIFQFRQNTSAGSPILSLELGDYGKGKGLYIHDQTKSPAYLIVASAAEIEGIGLQTWNEIVTSRTGRGGYRFKIFDELVASHSGINTIPPEASYAYIKTGLYRTPIQGTSEIKISDLSVSVPA